MQPSSGKDYILNRYSPEPTFRIDVNRFVELMKANSEIKAEIKVGSILKES